MEFSVAFILLASFQWTVIECTFFSNELVFEYVKVQNTVNGNFIINSCNAVRYFNFNIYVTVNPQNK